MIEMNHSLRIAENTACRYRSIRENGIRVIWELTGRCNLHCRHCFADVTPIYKQSEQELTTTEALKIATQFDTVPVAKVMITGGEVFVRDDIECIIQAIRQAQKNIVIDITTNALLLDDNRIARLQALGVNELSVSIDGPKAIYQSVRGNNADYERLIYNIRQLIARGIYVDGIMVLNRLTIDALEATVSDAERIGLSSLTVANLEQLPHSNFPYEQLCLSDSEIADSLQRVERLRYLYDGKLVVRTTGFINCVGAGRCNNKSIVAIDRNGMYRHCLNVYTPEDLRLDSRVITFQSAIDKLNNQLNM